MRNNLSVEFNKDFYISTAHVDFQEKLKCSSLTNYLIQSAWHHAVELGWGSEVLIKEGLAWVLSGFQVEINNIPEWKQEVRLQTWPKGLNRFFYLRDYILYNHLGEKIGRASSNWLIINIKSRRPKVYEIDEALIESNRGRHAIADCTPLLQFEMENDVEQNHVTRYSDIDLNNHLTTTRYIEWMFDTFSQEEAKQIIAYKLIVYFTKEVGPELPVVMGRSKLMDNRYRFQLTSPDKSIVYFRGELLLMNNE